MPEPTQSVRLSPKRDSFWLTLVVLWQCKKCTAGRAYDIHENTTSRQQETDESGNGKAGAIIQVGDNADTG
jgi:hypothetical protein